MRKLFKVTAIFVAAISIFVSIVLLIQIFKIKKVIVISDTLFDIKLSVFSGKNFLNLHTKNAELWLLKHNQQLKEITVEKEYPDKIVLRPLFRLPAARIAKNSDTILVDDQGVLLSLDKYIPDLPLIEIERMILSDEQTDWRLAKALQYIVEFDQHGISIQKVNFEHDNSLFFLLIDGDYQVVVRQEDYPPSVAASLQTIISRFRIEGKNVSKVDFRFDKPLIVLKNE